MKKLTLKLLIFWLLAICVLVQAQEEASPEVKALHSQAEQEFENTVVARFAKFFEVKPKLLVAEVKGSAGDSVYFINEYTCRKINYAVQTSQTEKVALTGNLLLSISRRDNRSCGDVAGVVMVGPKAGWKSPQDAIANQSKERCYRQSRKAGLQEIQLEFVYQEGEWLFQTAQNKTTATKASQISDALKGDFFATAQREFNNPWHQLVKN